MKDAGEGIFKDGKHWKTKFSFKGRLYKLSTGCTDKEAAREEAKRIRERVERRAVGLPDYDETARTDPFELLERYLAEKTRTGKDKDHIQTIRVRTGRFFSGLPSIAPITTDHIRATLQTIAVEPIANRAPKAGEKVRLRGRKTQDSYLRNIRWFYDWLVRENLWPTNPATAIEELGAADPVVEYRPALPEERSTLLGTVPAARLAAYVVVAGMGLRPAEMRRLKVEDVDLDAKLWALPNLRIWMKTAKNRKEHLLPIHPDVALVLRPLLEGKEPTDAVFDELPCHETVKRDVLAAGLTWSTRDGVLVLTSLRKAFSTDLDRHGVSPELRRKLTRHTSSNLGDRVYTGYELKEKYEAVTKLTILPAGRRAELIGRPQLEKPDENPVGPPTTALQPVPFSTGRTGPLTTAKGLKRLTEDPDLPSSGDKSVVVKSRRSTVVDAKAEVAELADALDSGSSALTGVQVQVLSSATRDAHGGYAATASCPLSPYAALFQALGRFSDGSAADTALRFSSGSSRQETPKVGKTPV